MELVVASLEMLFVLVLLGAALHKLLSADRMAAAAARLAGVPDEFGRLFSHGAAVWEVIAALLIFYEPMRDIGLIAAAMLWSIYAIASWSAKRRGQAFDCGCTFGSAHGRSDPLTFLRAATLSAGAICAAFFPVRPLFEFPAIFAGVAFFGLLVAAGELAVAIPTSRRISQ